MQRLNFGPALSHGFAATPAQPIPAARSRPAALLLGWVLASLIFLLPGCASLPSGVARPVSQAFASPAETVLGKAVQNRASAATARADSGFYLLDNAALAFSTRLALIDSAEKSLDLQYYAIHSDETTDRLLDGLRRAAARGVRIRILLDDFNISGEDAQVLQLAFVPGIELRVFNPIPGSRSSIFFRVLGSLKDVDRIQRRMHNKIFVADNAMAVTGGRNLGETYFGKGNDTNFVDIDVLAGGRIVRDISRSFDQYWNNPLAYPAESLVEREELDALKRSAARNLQPPQDRATSAPSDPVPSPAPEPRSKAAAAVPDPVVNLASIPWVWAPSVLMVDKPSKIGADQSDVEDAQETLVDGLLQLVSQAQRELLIVSPYFVPGPRMLEQLAAIRRKGVRIRVLTNSLSSNDAPAAHVGYARYRKSLLALGIELHEMRAEQGGSLAVFGSSGALSSKASLHSKIVVMDGRLVVIGSMNLDLRSQLQNTEIALVIRSRALAAQATRVIEPTLSHGAYRVELLDGQLRWRAPEGASFKDQTSEPDASAGLKLLVQLLEPFAPDEML
ncbi:MAG: phospholipase D family protein [Pseudomonadota bacterium]